MGNRLKNDHCSKKDVGRCSCERLMQVYIFTHQNEIGPRLDLGVSFMWVARPQPALFDPAQDDIVCWFCFPVNLHFSFRQLLFANHGSIQT